MKEGDPGQLFSDQLREWADEGIAKIEREARRDFAELLETAILNYLANSDHICYNHRAEWERSEVRAEVIAVINNLVKECEED